MFNKWDWKKNLTAKDWQVLARKILKRGRESEPEAEVRFRGALLSSKKLKKETSRHRSSFTSKLFKESMLP